MYRPIMGLFLSLELAYQKHKDGLIPMRQLIRSHPKLDYIVSNLLNRPLLYVIKNDLKREVLQNPQNFVMNQPMQNLLDFFEPHSFIQAPSYNYWKFARNFFSDLYTYERLKELSHDVIKNTMNVIESAKATPLKN